MIFRIFVVKLGGVLRVTRVFLLIISMFSAVGALFGQAERAYSAYNSCENPYVLNDSVAYISIDTVLNKYWFKFIATKKNTSLLIFDGEGNQHCEHLVFELTDSNSCDLIHRKELLPYRDKVVERMACIDTDTCLSVESLKYGYCNCVRCRKKPDILKTIPGREYLLVVYGNYFALQIGHNCKSMKESLKQEAYAYDPFQQVSLEVGKSIELHNILFRSNSDRFMPEANNELQQLLKFLKKNPSVYIQIEGHVNAPREKPSRSLMRLSDKRADAVYWYLVEAGIDRKRMTTRGYGNMKMIYPRARFEKQFKRNRRVEILITDIIKELQLQ